jgi:homotetrameric NADPH-dependent glutamate synthase
VVIGGGVAGIQTSLDLAGMGIKVYLLEKSPSIGGRMAQLDKTFPTNDCSMCILSPKMIECSNHPNIELLTYSELEEIQGEAGNFEVKIRKKTRFIDENKCVGCGDCTETCPVVVDDMFNAGLNKRKAIYKEFQQAVPAIYTIEKKGIAPCKAACPAHISVQGYVALISQGRFQEALDLIRRDNPLPAICGRACPHPCESSCQRGEIDEPIAINDLKRVASDYEYRSGKKMLPQIKEKRKEKVAIVGSGPAGLSAAYYLAIEGYSVIIFEALPVAGGMLTVGIPSYRLPRDIITYEIDYILEMGVKLKLNSPIGEKVTLNDLHDQGYDAVFMAIGAQDGVDLHIDGENLKGVHRAVDFLRKVNLGKRVSVGKKVAVIGGGNAAMDAVRTAKRLGAEDAFIIYRRGEEEMPANKEEIEEAREEGIQFHFLTAPSRILGDASGRVKVLELIRMELGEPDESGRRRPVPIQGSEYGIEIDTVISAIGQKVRSEIVAKDIGLKLNKNGTVKVDSITYQTNVPWLFSGGDAVSGPAIIIEAIAAGKEAAISINRFLRGESLSEGRGYMPEIAIPDKTTIQKEYRRRPKRIDPLIRIHNFDEVNLALSPQEAQEEAKRCLSCGVCSECYRCVDACQAGAIHHEMRDTILQLNVGAVVMATGFDLYDVAPLVEYGWGTIKNVITAMEFERMISASGPTGGALKRPSDGKHPERLGFIQCVGSRDIRHKRYCSAVCCMHATKEATLANEHYPDIRSTIFYIDLRAVGKGFQEYVRRASEEYFVEYIKARPGRITENVENQNPIVSYENTVERELIQREFDMVILAQALIPNESNLELARKLDIELDEFGFVEAPEKLTNPGGTSRSGVFACGFCQSPMDVPDSVIHASAAASKVAEILRNAS